MGSSIDSFSDLSLPKLEKAFIQARRTKVKSIFIQCDRLGHSSISITEWKWVPNTHIL